MTVHVMPMLDDTVSRKECSRQTYYSRRVQFGLYYCTKRGVHRL